MWVCLVVCKEQKIMIESYVKPLKISWANGMIGALPVFENKEDALTYINGDESLILEVAIDEKISN